MGNKPLLSTARCLRRKKKKILGVTNATGRKAALSKAIGLEKPQLCHFFKNLRHVY